MAGQPAKDLLTSIQLKPASKSPKVDTSNPPEILSPQAAVLANEEVSREAPGTLILEAPGTPSKAEGDRSDMDGVGKFELNSQSIAGLVFFYAWKVLKDREAAMALALCLEAALYWHLHAPDKQPSSELAKQQHSIDPIGNVSTPEPAGQAIVEHAGGKIVHGSHDVKGPKQSTSRQQPSKGSSERVSGGSVGRARSQSRDKATASGSMQQDKVSPAVQAVRLEPSMTSASIAVPRPEQGPAESNGVAGRPEQGLNAGIMVPGCSDGGSPAKEWLGERLAASAVARPKVNQQGEPSTAHPRSVSQPGSKARDVCWAGETAKADVRHRSEEGTRGQLRSEGAGVIPKAQQEDAVARSKGRPPSRSQSLAGKPAALMAGNGVSSHREASTGSQSTAKRKADSSGQAAMKRLKADGIENGSWKKRQETFSPKKLQPGMAVLLRTEPDDAGQWNKVWSLGRVIRVNLPRGSIDVTWLKPERMVSGAGYVAGKAPPAFGSPEGWTWPQYSGECRYLPADISPSRSVQPWQQRWHAWRRHPVLRRLT